MRVLAVDSDSQDRLAIEHLLTRRGHAVTAVADLLIESQFPLVVFRVRTTGDVEALDRRKKLDPQGHTAYLVLSGGGEMAAIRELGADVCTSRATCSLEARELDARLAAAEQAASAREIAVRATRAAALQRPRDSEHEPPAPSDAALAERQEKERFRQLSNATFEGIVIHDAGIIVDANQAFATMSGYRLEEVIGMHCLDFSTPASREHVRSRMEKEYEEPYEAVGLRKDGSTYVGELRGGAIEYNGRRLRVVALQDVTERRKLQKHVQMTERLASVGALAAGLGHEINNPLTYVMANLALLEARLALQPMTDTNRSVTSLALAQSIEGCERMRLVVRDLQRLSRGGPHESRAVNLHTLMDSCLRIVDHEIRQKARVVREYGAVPPALGSEAKLGQIFTNLLVNAAQAIDDGRADENVIRVVIRGDGGAVIVEIHDTGTGVPEQVKDRIFDPYVTTKDIGGGSGIGLSICHAIVTSLDGKISFERGSPTGTIFRVELHAAHIESIESPSLKTEHQGTRRAKVLVVDDEPLIGRSLQSVLAGDHDVVVAESARDALSRLASGPFDAILCDLMMPGMTGTDLYLELERVAPELAPRFVLITGGVISASTQAFLDRHGIQCLGKAFDLPILRDVIRRTAG